MKLPFESSLFLKFCPSLVESRQTRINEQHQSMGRAKQKNKEDIMIQVYQTPEKNNLCIPYLPA